MVCEIEFVGAKDAQQKRLKALRELRGDQTLDVQDLQQHAKEQAAAHRDALPAARRACFDADSYEWHYCPDPEFQKNKLLPNCQQWITAWQAQQAKKESGRILPGPARAVQGVVHRHETSRRRLLQAGGV